MNAAMAKKKLISPLTIDDAPLEGVVAVEASAGTGKTWTIAALVVRLVLELELPIERILVVTFTEAATAELKTRVRARLAETREHIATVGGVRDDDAFTSWLRYCVATRDRTRCLRILDAAINAFDLAPIHTIHAFCQRALAEHAFESGEPFAAELVPDESALVAEAVRDFWRRETANAEPQWSAWLRDANIHPASLAELVTEVDRKPYADFVPAAPAEAPRGDLAQRYAHAARLWRTSNAEVLRQVQSAIDAQRLAPSRYSHDKLPLWAAQLDGYFAGGVASPSVPDALRKLAADRFPQKARSALTHPFFAGAQALVEAADSLAQAFAARTTDLELRAIAQSRATLARTKRARGLFSYNDLVGHLARALQGAHGERLAAALRERYRAVLVDEFQDTDPLQAGIFTTVFEQASGPLYFVGDPKQAIYGFRGADVRAYLQACASVTRRTLRENFRSEPGLVAAVNALFDRDDPFLVDAIEFDPATAAARCEDDDAVVLPDSLARPFTLWYAARGEDGKAPNKDESRRAIAAATAGEIARLLEAGRAGSARIGGDSLSGHHVAVLVKSHYEAALVRAALAALRVPSVTYGQQSVFASHEAMELERVLLAVAHPTQEGLVRAALATDLLGATATAIATFDEDERRLERALEDFARYRDIAQREDFARMLRTLAVEREVAPRLLALDDGERRLINLLHLAELLESAAVREGLDLDGVVRRLAQARTAPMGDAESEQLRLESDEHLVSVLTIHAAKGLQFPIVFCPFLWSGFNRRRRSRALAFHEPETGRAMFDLAAEPERRHVELAEHEGLAESLRLAYVALTRAERRVVAVCGALKDWECSPLAWLLFGGQALAAEAHPVAALAARVKSVGDEELRARLDALVRESKGEIVVQELPRTCDVAMPAPPIPLPDFAARPFLGRVRERWRVTSYSGLVAQSNIESADHDALALPEPAELAEVTADASTLVLELPHGARFGEAVHALFETVDFTHLAPVEEQARGVLARFGLAPGLAPILARLVADVVATRLDPHPALRLADVPRARRIEELEFVLPTGAVAAAALTHALAADRTKAGIAVASEDAVASVAPGYLRGFVDLVFAADGRYWLADYKSNWLGPRYDDYAPDALARAMAEHLYDLQALLYVVAVDRYLATRVPGYDYERHFGGVFYLFVRGMRPDTTGPTRGVHFLKPAAAVVRSLSAAMARRGRTMP